MSDKGLGDTVERIIKKVLPKFQCEPCQKRKAKLNKLIPYKKKT